MRVGDEPWNSVKGSLVHIVVSSSAKILPVSLIEVTVSVKHFKIFYLTLYLSQNIKI